MKSQPPAENAPEFSRPLRVDRIPAGGVVERMTARPSERKALAERFGLLDLPMLEATLNADHASDGMVKVSGTMNAKVVQRCVVTLEPVPATIAEKIEVLCAPPKMAAHGANPPHDVPDAEEMLEPIVNGTIDLGELVSQHLAVSLNPYPRHKDAEIVMAEKTKESSPPPPNPFAGLADMLKGKD